MRARHNTARKSRPPAPASARRSFGAKLSRFEKTQTTAAVPETEAGYELPLFSVFQAAAAKCRFISMDPEVMAGAPCITGTRIPVYMILDAIEFYGNLEGAIRSYPRLTLEHVQDAVSFAKLVLECPIDDEPSVAP